MTEAEYKKSLENSVVISLETYNELMEKAVIVDRLKRVISNSKSTYGLSKEATDTVELLLGIERIDEE